jgi:hypothetical protein
MTKFRSRKGFYSFLTSAIAASVVLPLALTVTSSYADTPIVTPITLVAPSDLPGVPPMPFTGTTVPAFTIPSTYANLTVSPSVGCPALH